jgi:formiminotetrahydrofolate cyclodeaminase
MTADHRELPLAQRTLADVTAAIASDAVAPGSGAAAAIGLALAAACAAKAVAITRKHRAEETRLSTLREALLGLAERALEAGDEDGRRFQELMHDRTPDAAAAVRDEGERTRRAAEELRGLLDRLASEVDAVVLADILAARVLCDACAAIQTQNLEANVSDP